MDEKYLNKAALSEKKLESHCTWIITGIMYSLLFTHMLKTLGTTQLLRPAFTLKYNEQLCGTNGAKTD